MESKMYKMHLSCMILSFLCTYVCEQTGCLDKSVTKTDVAHTIRQNACTSKELTCMRDLIATFTPQTVGVRL